MVQNLPSKAEDAGLIAGRGTRILYAVRQLSPQEKPVDHKERSCMPACQN